VCERLIALLPHLEKYVKSVTEGKCPDPKTKSFDTVKQCVADPLLGGKLSFFLSVANQVTPFLAAYQTDKPMLPFLCADLYKMVKALMERFVKDDVMARVSSVQQLLKIDVGLKENHKVYSKIDIGFMAEKSLKSAVDQKTKKKISDKELMQFRMESKEFLIKLVKKIMEKSPLKYSLARNMSSLDPREMGNAAKESNMKKFKTVLTTMNEANRVADNEVEELLQQYSKYIDDTVVPHASEYSNFEVSTGRVDVLLFDTMANNPSLGKLWTCVKALLLLSHGQASVERGFSVNRQVEIDNLSEDTFVAKRLICDHVTSVGGLKNIDTSNKALLLAASSARRKYMDYLADERKKQESSGRGEKRKALDDEIEELKNKKRCLRKDVDAMTSSADEYAEKAEKTHQLTWIAKSNSLRRSAKEKTEELKAVDEQLDEKLLQLKNC